MSNSIEIWNIFDRPADYPNGFIARKSIVTAGVVNVTKTALVSDNLENLRTEFINRNLYCIPRTPDETAKHLVESWM
ncbi:MAG: hypothetical protein AAGD96_28245 [Chloroflexota bacterium]